MPNSFICIFHIFNVLTMFVVIVYIIVLLTWMMYLMIWDVPGELLSDFVDYFGSTYVGGSYRRIQRPQRTDGTHPSVYCRLQMRPQMGCGSETKPSHSSNKSHAMTGT